MSNPTFTTAAAGTPPPDPSKHVNYTQGMVLGVDDFQQEFAYLSNRDQWLARDAIGYGTVCGLHVSLDGAKPNTVSVSPGVAINPRGQLIRVAPRQCASLDAWLGLSTTVDRMNELGLGGSADFTAYVVLCYRDCPVDDLPVPGEPCRCDSTTMAPSRIIDDFRLELTLEAPPQAEEDIVRDFVTWLRGVEVAEFVPGPGALEEFLQAIRDAFGCGDSPPESPPHFYFESPPGGLRIPRDLLCEWMRAALRIWVTELRPCWQAQCAPKKSCACGGPCGCHGTGAQPDDMRCDCLLLAAVRIKRGGGAITGIEFDEERRPYLLHLRMLQELLYCGPSCCDSCGDSRSFATVYALDQDTLQIWIHHPVQLDLPDQAVTLELGGVPVTGFTISPAASPPGLNLFDLTLTGSPLAGIGNSTTIEICFDANLIHEPDGGTLASAIWQDGYCYGDYLEPRLRVFTVSGALVTLGGDVVGPPAQNQLTAIQGKPLNVAGVVNQQVLGFDNGVWQPVSLASNAPPVAENSFTTNAKSPQTGTSQRYARQDHTHGLPPDPIPPHNTNAAAHRNLILGGAAVSPPAGASDVRGEAANNIVVGLQRVPVSSAPLTNAQNGFVLTYQSTPNEWVAASPASGNAFKVTSGLVIFEEVGPGESRFSPPIEHGFKDQLVMIRLGLESENTALVEDVDSVFKSILMLAIYLNGAPDFYIGIEDLRQSQAWTWPIRWWAVPVTDAAKEPILVKKEEREVPRDVIKALTAFGSTVREVAGKVGVSEAKIRPLLKEMEADGAIRVVRGKVLPPG